MPRLKLAERESYPFAVEMTVRKPAGHQGH